MASSLVGGPPSRVMRKKMRAGDVDAPLPASTPATRDWSELPLDAVAFFFGKLGAIEILIGAGLVCRSWLQAAMLPELWRSVHMAHHKFVDDEEERSCSALAGPKINGDVLCAMARVAVDRSGGQMEEFVGRQFVTDELLIYIGDRSPALKTLALISCHFNITNMGLEDHIAKCPMLEDLMLVNCNYVFGRALYESIGKACPQLKRFTLCKSPCFVKDITWEWESSGEALGVAVMHELRSLALFNSDVTNSELLTVLDGCPRLESLDIRGCYNIGDNEELRVRCAAIKSLMMPPCPYVTDDDTFVCSELILRTVFGMMGSPIEI